MKGPLLSILLLSFSLTAFSQTITFHEDFEQPSGADSVTSISNTTNQWARSHMLAAQGVYSDSCRVAQGDTTHLVSMTFSTVGQTFVLLEFYQICKIEFFDAAEISYSTNNGQTWTRLTGLEYLGSGQFGNIGNKFTSTSYVDWLPANNSAIPANTWWKHEIFDLSTVLTNVAQAKIRFTLIDLNNTGAAGNYGWLLDHIKVTAAPSELIPPVVNLQSPVLIDSVYNTGPFTIHASITDASGIDTALLIYSYNHGPEDTVGMINAVGPQYFGVISKVGGFNVHDTLCYRVLAFDASTAHNSASAPATGCNEFVIYISPPPPGCSNPISSFPFVESFDSFTPGSGTPTFPGTLANGWTRNPLSGYMWMVQNGPTTSGSTGPAGDHTTGSGNYMYGEVSYGATGNIAYLESPCIDITALNAPELEFYYHMWGTTIGELHVDIYYGGTWTLDIIQPLVGDQGNAWKKATVSLAPYRSVTSVRFRIVHAGCCTGDIAIDDVKIWEPPANDAGVVSIDRPISPAAPGLHPVKVTFKNFGSASLNKVKIDWRVNGVAQPTYNWTGNMLPGLQADTFQIGTYNFGAGPATIKAWTRDPNDSLDGWNVNDTALATIIACSSPLHGTYVIGGPNPDFVNLSDALFALANCGIDSAIVFKLSSGTYGQQVTLDTIPGSSSTNTVTFESVSGNPNDVVVEFAPSGTTDNWVWRFDGVSYVTVKNITIKANGTSYGRVVEIINGSNHITLEGNIIQSLTAVSSYAVGIYSDITNDEYTTIRNNEIRNGYYSIYLRGASSTQLEQGHIIEGNVIKDFYAYGMYLFYSQDAQIVGNEMVNSSSSYSVYPIYTYYSDGALRIVGNKIKAFGQSSVYGIRVYYSDASSSNHSLVANNFLSIHTTASSYAYGLYCYYSTFVDLYHNSINIINANPQYSYALYHAYGSDVNIVNNILTNDAEGLAYYTVTPTAINNSDYNDLYTTGADLAYWSGTTCTDLAALKALSGKEAHSLSVQPAFVDSVDLHLTNTALTGMGTALPSVTTDIDGDPRDLNTPAIGADEMPPIPIDAGVVTIISPQSVMPQGTMAPVSVIVRNFGTDTLGAFTVSYQLGMGSPVTSNYVGPLAPATNDTVVFANISVPPGPYTICAQTILASDTNLFNNMKCLGFYGTPIRDIGPIELTFPDTGACYSNAEKVQVLIRNHGSQSLVFNANPVSVWVEVDGPSPTVLGPAVINSGVLASGATLSCVVTNTFDMSQSGLYTFRPYTNVSGDGDMTNDTMEHVPMMVYSTITSFPFIETFENFTPGNPGTFENGWTPVPNTDAYVYKWQVNAGPTSTTTTGPDFDHTLGTAAGKFVYTEANGGASGTNTSLVSPCLDLSSYSHPTLRFWYHLYGDNIYTMRVDVFDGNYWHTSVGHLFGQQQVSGADPWKQHVVDLAGFNDVVRLRFRGIKGAGLYGDMAIDDLYLYEPLPRDAGISAIVKPTIPYANVGASVQVEAIIENYGYDTLYSTDLIYLYGSGIPVQETWTGALPPYQSTVHTFSTPFIAQAGEKTLCGFTQLPNDGNHSNDTTCVSFTGLPTITVPFTDDFEGVNYWVSSGGYQQWERGVPAGVTINQPHSGTNVWMTDLDADYENQSSDFLFSPYFDFSQATDATLSFWHWINSETTDDFGTVQYSNDGGNTWQTLGYIGDPNGTNWYTSNSGGIHGWSGQSNAWVHSSYLLSQFNNASNPIQFRFRFASDISVNSYDGWAIDDFEITLPPIASDAGIISIDEPNQYHPSGTNLAVKVTIKNFGTTTLTSIPLSYKINGGTPVTATWTGNLVSGGTVQYAFPTPFTTSGAFTVCAKTSLSGDTYTFNDELCITKKLDAGISWIQSPGSALTMGQPETVKVRIENYGTEPITTMDVAFQLALTPIVSESWAGNLGPGDHTYYTFTTPLTPLLGMYQLCAFTQLSGDNVQTNNGACKFVTGAVGIDQRSDLDFSLYQNIPNPATQSTIIPFELKESSEVTLKLSDLLGRNLMEIQVDAYAGYNEINLSLGGLKSGIYFYTLQKSNQLLTKRMLVY